MPLETYVGDDVRALFAQVEDRFGPNAMVVHVKQVRDRFGPPRYEMLAGDATADTVDRGRRYLTIGNSTEVSGFAPKTGDLKPVDDGRPAIIAVVGPTGAGKTTTVAKLATHEHIFGRQYVGLATLDTFRVGAVDQLRTFADIARIPMQVAASAREVESVLKRLETRDVVVLDTPGWGPRNGDTRDATIASLKKFRPDEVHLAVPARTARFEVERLLEDYMACGVTHLLVTKADETSQAADVIEVAVRRRIPMRWLTDGQDVPTDIRSARPRLLAAMGVAIRAPNSNLATVR